MLVARHWFLVASCWFLVAGFWLLVAGYWLLGTGFWLLVAGYWFLGMLTGLLLSTLLCLQIFHAYVVACFGEQDEIS
jgi:hypothetical protein